MSQALTAILHWAKFLGVSPPLLAAICHFESGGLNEIQTHPPVTESVGMCQILPSTAHSFGFKQGSLTDPTLNAQFAAKWLAVCYERYPTRDARIACYNSGHATTRRGYVKNVLKYLPKYCALKNFRRLSLVDEYCAAYPAP